MKTKRFSILCLAVLLGACMVVPCYGQITMNFDATQRGPEISPYQYGLFFEEINHAGDGGLYAEMVRNRSFEDNVSSPDYWQEVNGASISLVTSDLLNSAQGHALSVTTSSASSSHFQGVSNVGYWGMSFVKDSTYTLSFYAKVSTSYALGTVKAQLQSADGSKILGESVLPVSLQRGTWEKYTVSIKAAGTDEAGRLALLTSQNGTMYLDVVSLFPYTWKDRKNGLRPDLAQKLYDTHPKFLRFPGGCYVEGQGSYDNAFQWKKTLGPIEDRPGHYDKNWGYWSQDGLGFDEYLQLCEDLGAAPLFVVNIGLGHGFSLSMDTTKVLVQDCLDAIEYANGGPSTEWGAKRIANGHRDPYNLKFIEIGNENYNSGTSDYPERYKMFYDAIKAKYPDITCIGNVEAWGTDNPSWRNDNPVDLVDEHYYRTSDWMLANYDKYDNYSRAIGVYNGEYAANSGSYGEYGNLKSALGEAVYMLGMERNSDVCRMASFAPIFTNVKDPTWPYDMIHYNAAKSFCTPSYYVQKMMGQNSEGQNLKWTETGNSISASKHLSLGSWNTQVSYDDVKVVDGNGNTLFFDDFSSDKGWTASSGTWGISDGIKTESGNSTPALIINSQSLPDNYTITLKARKNGGDEGFLVGFEYFDSDDYSWWNIAGWGNTRNAVEVCRHGTKTTVDNASGSIETGTWYNLKISVKDDSANFYINNELINKCALAETPASAKAVYQSAQLNDAGDEMTLKIVNPLDSVRKIKLTFKNMKVDGGSVIRLASTSNLDENTMDDPEKVVPLSETILSRTDTVCVPAYSLNIFKLKVSDAVGAVADSAQLFYHQEDADKYGYLYAHMNSSKEITNYALSRQGDAFNDLLSGGEVFDTKKYTATGGMRDAYVGRLQNGQFLLVGTDMTSRLGWNSNHIMDMMLSPDLVHWTKEVKIDLKSDANLKALGLSSADDMTAAWAPEFIYDPQTKDYVLYYTVGFPDRHRIYYQLFDADLNLLTEPKLYFDPGYDLIDADIQYNEVDKQYIMIYKSELTRHNLLQARATQLVPSGSHITGTCQWNINTDFDYTEGSAAIEAPSLYRKIGDKNWRLAYENYSGGGYSLLDLDEHCNHPMNLKRMEGNVQAQHGSFLKLTEKEYNYLLTWDSVKTLLPVVQSYDKVCTNNILKSAIDKADEALGITTTFEENITRMNEACELLKEAKAVAIESLLDSIATGKAADVTGLIVNPQFSDRSEGWTLSAPFTTADGKVAEYWNTNFDFYQDLQDMPAGDYELGVQGFFRYGSASDAYSSHNDGTEKLNAVLYANDTVQPMMSIFDAHSYSYSPYTYPDNVSDANIAFNTNDSYHNTLRFTLDKEGAIRIGIKKNTYVYNDWCVFDNFTLKYMGNSTGIHDVYNKEHKVDSKIYNLQGMRLVGEPLHGVFIKEGKKYVN